MAVPVLIDTDMGIDDAVAACLAMSSERLDVRGLVAVGGNVPSSQAVENIGRLVATIRPRALPAIGQGLDQTTPGLMDRTALFGRDGFGECDLAPARKIRPADFREVYKKAIDDAGGELVILALAPLTNIAALLDESPDLLGAVRHIYISGGAVWTQGNATPAAEFNMHRDPAAAARVLASGRPITVAPLDVSGLVALDESHVAHLAASGYRTGEVLARLLRFALEQDVEPAYGKCHVHDAITAGSLLWPDLFLKTRMRLDVVTDGPQTGRTKPALGGDSGRRIDLLTAVNAVDFLEILLESLCHEAFVV